MPKAPTKKPSPLTVVLTADQRRKLNRLIAYAMTHDVTPHPGRVVRTLIEMVDEGPEFLKAVKAMDEREREGYREKRGKL
jgi:hypothetical protein